MGTQLITLGLKTESAGTPVTVTGAEYLLDYKLYGVNAAGEFVTMDVRGSRATVVDGRAEALIYAAEGLMPGAVIYGDDFGLACMTIWQEGEGEGVYATVADVTLSDFFTGGEFQPKLLQGFTAEYRNGEIVVDWSAAGGYLLTENTVFNVYSTVTSNPYLSRDVLEDGETSVIIPAPPGMEVMVWIVVSEGELEESLYPETVEEVCFVDVPMPEPFTLNGLKNLRCGITPGKPGKDGAATDFLPQEPLTRKALMDSSRPIYFQTEDAYTCAAQDDAHTLMVTLYTPEGYCYYYNSGYVFMPEMNGGDLWIADISELFADYERFCEGDLWPAGEDRVRYTIGGGEVARFTFSLE